MLENFRKNLAVNTDSYKSSMWSQYPPGTETVFSYIESRGGKYEKSLFVGLQAFLKEYLSEPVTLAQIEFAANFWSAHGEPFNKAGWLRLIEKYNGVLPIRIRAVKEGTVVPVSNVLVTVENTDPEFFWLTTWLETAILRAVWYPVTVATQGWYIKQTIKKYLEETGDPSGINFKLHDFGQRGVSSFESAAIGGLAHLVNFMGSDTVNGVIAANEYYQAGMSGFSIPASEHSTITSWGRENEEDAYRNMIKQFGKPGALLACVSDSYDIYEAAKMWGTTLKQDVIDSGAMVVIRPDSGTPELVVLEVVRILDRYFGSVENEKGYRVLNNVRVIQGDGINADSIKHILENLKSAGYSADNVAFGMGGQNLQILNRDTMKFAMKCSAIQVNGEWRDVYKDPVTDQGKRSKKGRITLIRNGADFMTVPEDNVGINSPIPDLLETVWENGKLVRQQSFAEIRELSDRG
jgi:nicotinamide phosphoribosyltransferase